MSTIKDITIKLGKGRFVTTTIKIYSNLGDNEYTVPDEDNRGGVLDSEEREFIRDAIEAKILKLRIDEDHVDDYSDDMEEMDTYVENHY